MSFDGRKDTDIWLEDFLNDLFDACGWDVWVAQLIIDDETKTYTAELDGEDKDKALGRDGLTLDAVQHLAVSAAANNGIFKDRIVVDVDGFRKRRDDTLMEEAARLADETLESGSPRDMDPMNARERRLVHMIVSRIDGVTTESMGMGDERYVRLLPTNL